MCIVMIILLLRLFHRIIRARKVFILTIAFLLLLLKFVLAHDNFIATPSLQLNLFPAFFFLFFSPQSFSNSCRVFLKKLGRQRIFLLKKYTKGGAGGHPLKKKKKGPSPKSYTNNKVLNSSGQS